MCEDDDKTTFRCQGRVTRLKSVVHALFVDGFRDLRIATVPTGIVD
jgi:hypothetical protein